MRGLTPVDLFPRLFGLLTLRWQVTARKFANGSLAEKADLRCGPQGWLSRDLPPVESPSLHHRLGSCRIELPGWAATCDDCLCVSRENFFSDTQPHRCSVRRRVKGGFFGHYLRRPPFSAGRSARAGGDPDSRVGGGHGQRARMGRAPSAHRSRDLHDG